MLQHAFCARLKSARERRGISLAAVAEQTKVTSSFFVALERGDISRWPKGIYRRAFFRGYVDAIGLPPDSTVSEFLRLFPEGDSAAAGAEAAPPPRMAYCTGATSLRLTLASGQRSLFGLARASREALVDSVVVAVLALLLVWWADLGAPLGAALVAIASYPTLARAFREQRAARRRPAASEAASEEDEPEPEIAADPIAEST